MDGKEEECSGRGRGKTGGNEMMGTSFLNFLVFSICSENQLLDVIFPIPSFRDQFAAKKD